MRTLAITQNITLDGSIDMREPWFDPGAQLDPDLVERLRLDNSSCDAVLLGRGTFEALRSYWPHQTDDPTGISEHLNGVRKYVVSTTLRDPQWANSTVVDTDPVAAVRAIKQTDGHDIVLTGSVELCHQMLSAGLVDEIRLYTYPFVQGYGRRLFPEGFSPTPATLLESVAFGNGVTFCNWRLG